MKQFIIKILQNKKIAVQLAIACTALILIACLIPAYRVPNMQVPLIDKWAHFIIFAAFAFCWSATYKSFNFRKYIFVVFLSFFFGWLVEVIQGSGITSGRSFELMDIVADGIGGIMGGLIYWILYKILNLEVEK